MNFGPEEASITALSVFIVKELWTWFKGSAKDALKATQENTMAVQKMSFEVGALSKQLEKLPKIEKDIHEAHARIRVINAKLGGKFENQGD